MRLRLSYVPVALLAVGAAVPASAQSSIADARRAAQQAYRRATAEARELYQGRRSPEQTETFARKIKVGRDGRVSISNISGVITVTAASGDEVSIDAVKRGRADRGDLDRVRIVVEEHPGRVDVRTDYGRPPFPDRLFRDDRVSVDYTVVVPVGASLDLSSISGRIRVDGVNGSVRLASVSGNITSSRTPRVEYLRTVSGEVELANISQDGNLSLSSVSGNIDLNGVKARALDVNSVSGEIRLRDAAIDRLTAKGLSGSFEYAGALVRNGRYEVNEHSGNVRFTITDTPGFELNAGSFSGAVHSDFQMAVGGDRTRDIRTRRGPRSESLRATFGDGSAALNVRTFSGSISILRR
jgi:Putative adhesin